METSQITVLSNGDESALESFLLGRLESSMFLLGNMRAAGLSDHGGYLEGTYAGAVDQGRIVGVVAHYWNGNLVLQAPEQTGLLCAAAAVGSSRPVGGFIGPAAQVEAAMQRFGIVSLRVQLDETEHLYSLELDKLAVPDSLSSGRLIGRRIQADDVGLVTRWTARYSVEALGDQESPELEEQCRLSVERAVRRGTSWVIERDGELVSHSAFNAAIKEAVQVGGVWTPPELRGHGYGRAAVAASLVAARAEGAEKAILFTGEKNLPAQKAYLALGFRPVGDYRIVLLRSPVEPVI